MKAASPLLFNTAKMAFSQKIDMPSRKEFILKAKSNISPEELQKLYPDWDEAMQERSALLKKKRVLRRYMRLKRNNFVRAHQKALTPEWYVEKYLPKI